MTCVQPPRPAQGQARPAYSMAPVRARLAELAPGRRAAREPALRPGRGGQRPGLRGQAGRGHRRLRQRRLRRRPPRPRLDRRAAADAARRRPGACCSARSRCCSACATHPKRPFVAVLGGAKVSDKLGVIDALLDVVDALVIGGGMCFTFLAAQGNPIGDSLFEPDQVDDLPPPAGRRRKPIHLPRTSSASTPDGDGAPRRHPPARRRQGPRHRARARRPRSPTSIIDARTVFWNGPMGCSRTSASPPARARWPRRWPTPRRSRSSAAATRPRRWPQFGLDDEVDHVSTGGGASLELLELGDLPGLAALRRGAERP